MAEIIIRPLERSDEAEWRRLWTGYLDYYETTVPEAVYASTFARLLGDDPQDFNGLLALVDGKPMGLTHYLFHRHCWKIENVCYLQDLYVDPQARGTGLGRQADRGGLCRGRCQWHARGLLADAGFQRDGTAAL